MLKRLSYWFIFLSFVHTSVMAEVALEKTTIDLDNYVLVDIVLNNKTIVRSLDMYFIEERQYIAIEPLLDSLKVRYQLSDTRLVIWHNNTSLEYLLIDSANESNLPEKTTHKWATDDFYLYVDLQVFEEIFNVKLKYKPRRLKLEMFVPKDQTIFPVQLLAEQKEQRFIDRLVTKRRYSSDGQSVPITINDQYRAFTIPHGRINIAAEQSEDGAGFNSSFQLTSDLLYHSAQLTLTKSKDTDFASRLMFSRYKTSPDDYILNLYDQYQFGDISSRSNNLTTGTTSGLGAILERRSEGFRDTNQFITLKETAPPGWEAELFRNQIFLKSTTVPDDGLLIFDEVEVTYGSNQYSIKLYGPYGETEVINKQYDLTKNALSKGQIAHSIYALDRTKQLLRNNSSKSYSVTDYGGTFDYGVNDNWQIGFGFAGFEGDEQLFSLSNALSLPGMLLENDISINQEGEYAQQTSLQGSAFNQDRYNIKFESGKSYRTDNLLSENSYLFDATYFLNTSFMGINFGTDYRKDSIAESYGVSNRLSGNLGRLLLRHNLAYNHSKLFIGNKSENTNLLGSLGISGTLPYQFRVSANINYDPQASDVILDTSSVVVQKNIEDPWGTRHYLTFNYLPIAGENRDSWRLSHRASWRTGNFQLNLANEFGDNDRWSIQLGLQFFLGYDYRNQRVTFSERMLANTASLDVHAYLDRQINGIPDPLDYNLEGVSFTGTPQWKGILTGDQGKAVLPGVYPNTPFQFAAKWKDGSNAINNDYVVYTHPGAYIQVNMPFVLSTELIGFVLRGNNNQEVGLQNIKVELYDENNELLKTQDTDLDGYFEFLGLSPGQYRVALSSDTLRNKGYTSDTVGFDVTTGGNGGYAELPPIVVRRVGDSGVLDAEKVAKYRLNEGNSEPTVWDNDANVRKNYFTLPTKNKVEAPHSINDNEKKPKPSVQITHTSNNKPASDKFSSNEVTKRDNALPTIKVAAPSDIQSSIDNVGSDEKTNKNPTHLKSNQTKLNSTEAFAIQLGIYKELRHARKLVDELSSDVLLKINFSFINDSEKGLTRVIYGNFPDKQSGLRFASQNFGSRSYFVRPVNLALLNNELSKSSKVDENWFIQLYASATPALDNKIIQRFSNLKELNLAQKNSNRGKLYCLVSKGFESKQAAQTFLANMDYSGWVINRNELINVEAIN